MIKMKSHINYTELNNNVDRYIQYITKKHLGKITSELQDLYLHDMPKHDDILDCKELLTINGVDFSIADDYFVFSSKSDKYLSVTNGSWFYDYNTYKSKCNFFDNIFMKALNINFATALALRHVILQDIENNVKEVQPIKHLIYDFEKNRCLDNYSPTESVSSNEFLGPLDCYFIETLIISIMFDTRVTINDYYLDSYDDNPEFHASDVKIKNNINVFIESLIFNSYFQTINPFVGVLIRIAIAMSITRRLPSDDGWKPPYNIRFDHITMLIRFKINSPDTSTTSGNCLAYSSLLNYMINKPSNYNDKFAWLFNRIYHYSHLSYYEITKLKFNLEQYCSAEASSFCTTILPCLTTSYSNLFNKIWLKEPKQVKEQKLMDLFIDAKSFKNNNEEKFESDKKFEAVTIEIMPKNWLYANKPNHQLGISYNWGCSLREIFDEFMINTCEYLILTYEPGRRIIANPNDKSSNSCIIFTMDPGIHAVKFNEFKSIKLKNVINSIIDNSKSVIDIQNMIKEAVEKDGFSSKILNKPYGMNHDVITDYVIAFAMYELLCKNCKNFYTELVKFIHDCVAIKPRQDTIIQKEYDELYKLIDDYLVSKPNSKFHELFNISELYEKHIIEYCVFIYGFNKTNNNYNIYYISDINSDYLISSTPLHLACSLYQYNETCVFYSLKWLFHITNNSILPVHPLYNLCGNLASSEIAKYRKKYKVFGGNRNTINIIFGLICLFLVTVLIISLIILFIRSNNNNCLRALFG